MFLAFSSSSGTSQSQRQNRNGQIILKVLTFVEERKMQIVFVRYSSSSQYQKVRSCPKM